MPKTLITAALAAATLSAGAIGAPVQAASWGVDASVTRTGDAQLQDIQYRRGGCFAGERYCNDRLRWERSHRRHLVWRDGRYYDNDTGTAIAGGILGFALGAAIAGSQDDYTYYDTHRNDRGWRVRCRSLPGFDWRSGTYVGRDGYRHYCVR